MDGSRYIKIPYVGLFLVLLSVLVTCRPQDSDPGDFQNSNSKKPQYARGFQWETTGGITLLKVTRPWAGAQRSYTYALIPKGKTLPDSLNIDQTISIPVTNLVVTSTSHIPALDMMGVSHYLSGFPQTQYITSSKMREQIDRGTIEEVGAANGLNYEALIELSPQLIMTYQSGPDDSELEALQLTGIPTVINADFLEESPLGRAEWIKFTGLLLDKYDHADSIFKIIENAYLTLADSVRSLKNRPRVFSGSLYGDSWFAPAGNSFFSKFIQDAGGEYVWRRNRQTGSLELSFEAVIEENSNTDFWLGVGGFTSLGELEAADPRYANFQAFQESRVYNYHGRRGASGGFEYLELGGARPDIVLQDFIKILHPQLLPDYHLYFFQRLDP